MYCDQCAVLWPCARCASGFFSCSVVFLFSFLQRPVLSCETLDVHTAAVAVRARCSPSFPHSRLATCVVCSNPCLFTFVCSSVVPSTCRSFQCGRQVPEDGAHAAHSIPTPCSTRTHDAQQWQCVAACSLGAHKEPLFIRS